MKSSPGIMFATSYRSAASWPSLTTLMDLRSSSDRLGHGDEFGPVRKCRLHLDVVDHLRDSLHHLRAGQDLGAGLHQVGDRAAIARPFNDEVGDEGDGLGMVQLDAALEPSAR